MECSNNLQCEKLKHNNNNSNIVFCLQRKEPVGDSEDLPENVVSGLEELTPEMLQVECIHWLSHS